MSAFALFFALFAALRRGRLSMRDLGLSIVVFVHEWLEDAESFYLSDVARLHGWMAWAEWAARRADPAAARRLIRREEKTLAGLARRMAACVRVLADAPDKRPKRRGARRLAPARRDRRIVRPITRHAARHAALCPQARAPPTTTLHAP